MKEYHMDSFAMNVLDIGVCYLGFTWEELGLSKPSDVEIDCTALLDDMLDGGIFGQNDMNRVHSANITLNAAENESVNAASGILASLFPGRNISRRTIHIQGTIRFYCQWRIYTGYLNT